jgi:hypothetical protein
MLQNADDRLSIELQVIPIETKIEKIFFRLLLIANCLLKRKLSTPTDCVSSELRVKFDRSIS